MINKSYKKEIDELKSQDWIHKVYKENLGGVVGYFIQFVDGSFLVGKINNSTFEYSEVQDFSYFRESDHVKLFMNFIDVMFDGQLARYSFMKVLHKEFSSDNYFDIDNMSKEWLEAEMLQAAKKEDFEKAAMLKKQLEER